MAKFKVQVTVTQAFRCEVEADHSDYATEYLYDAIKEGNIDPFWDNWNDWEIEEIE